MERGMQTLLDDIELDIQELKYLMQALTADANPTLKVVAKRRIQQMHARLDALQKELEETPEKAVAVPETDAPPVVPVEPSPVPDAVNVVVETVETVTVTSTILGERIKPATDLRHAISLNDSFRFAREIFGGDTTRMNETIHQLGNTSSLDKALELFSATVHPDEENEAVADFIELLKKYFS